MATIQRLIDETISNLEKKIDLFTFHETCTVIFSILIEEDRSCWIKVREIMARIKTRCEEQPSYVMPPEMLVKFIEFTFLMKLALHLGKQIEIDHDKTFTSSTARLM
jgi:hypothetical protein